MSMISLVAIKNHMSQVKIATLGSLCLLFNTDPDTLRCMLKHWMCKGKIRMCTKKLACGNQCFKCSVLTTEIYEWVV